MKKGKSETTEYIRIKCVKGKRKNGSKINKKNVRNKIDSFAGMETKQVNEDWA